MNKKPRSLANKTISIQPTKAETLYVVLRDYAWHATRELVRTVGHTFAVAKFKLVRLGYEIEKRRHPENLRDWQYRLEPPQRITRRPPLPNSTNKDN
jgi:hypothetical protein